MFDLKDLMSRVNLPQDITRRGFLQVATVTAAFAAMNQSRAQTGAQPYIILETPKGSAIPLSASTASAAKWLVPNLTTVRTTRFWLVFVSAAIFGTVRATPVHVLCRAFGATALSIRTPAVSAPTLSLVLMPARRVPSASTPRPAPAMWMKTSASAADSARKPVRGT